MSFTPTVNDFHQAINVDAPASSEEFVPTADDFHSAINTNATDFLKSVLNRSFLPLAGGALKGIQEVGTNIANVPRSLGFNTPEFKTSQVFDPKQYLPESKTTNAMMMAGELLGGGGATTGLYKLLSKALLSPSSSIIKRMLLGGGVGYGSGNDEHGGRYLGAGLGALIPGGYGLSEAGIGKRAVEIRNQLSEKYKNLYDGILSSIEKEIPESVKVRVPSFLKNPSEQLGQFFSKAKPEYKTAIKEFEQNPTFRNAHEAQSEIRKAKQNLQNRVSSARQRGEEPGKSLTDAITTADELRKKIQGEMLKYLSTNGKGHFVKEYSDIAKGYAKEKVPFNNPAFYKEESKNIGKSRLANKLLHDIGFAENKASEMIPGFRARESLNRFLSSKIAPVVLAGGTGLAGYLLGQSGLGHLNKYLP